MLCESFEQQWNYLTELALQKMGNDGYPIEALDKLEARCAKILEEVAAGERKVANPISYHAALENAICKEFKKSNVVRFPDSQERDNPYVQTYHETWEMRLKELLTWQGVDEKSQDKMITKWLDGDSTSKPKTLEQFYIYRMYDMREQVEQEILDWKKANAFKPMVARASIPLWER